MSSTRTSSRQEKKERAKKDLIAKIEDLDMTIKSLTDAIAKLKTEIAEMQVQMKRAGEDREKENKPQMPINARCKNFSRRRSPFCKTFMEKNVLTGAEAASRPATSTQF